MRKTTVAFIAGVGAGITLTMWAVILFGPLVTT